MGSTSERMCFGYQRFHPKIDPTPVYFSPRRVVLGLCGQPTEPCKLVVMQTRALKYYSHIDGRTSDRVCTCGKGEQGPQSL